MRSSCSATASSPTPLVSVIAELERKSNTGDVLATMDQWWHVNAGVCVAFPVHTCTTALSDDTYPPIPGRRDDCQHLIRDFIIDHALTPRSVPAQDLHVIIFGETGTGKGSPPISTCSGTSLRFRPTASHACSHQQSTSSSSAR